MKNYLTYPCKVMNITQGYTGNTSHAPHNTGSPKDYPWDEACEGSGRSPMYCPCDEMIIKRIYTKGTNTIWLESTTPVCLADDTTDYVTLLVTHPNDSDVARLKEGQKFKRGDLICYEGTDGNATGNHFHFAVGKGKIKGNGWIQNSKGKWVLNCSGGADKPENLFYIDKKFTTVKKSNGLKFKELPKDEPVVKPNVVTKKVTAIDHAKEKLASLSGTYKTTAALNIRHGAGTNKKIMVTIPKGTKVNNYGYYTNNLGVKWLCVQFTYKNVTYTGFASSRYLSKV